MLKQQVNGDGRTTCVRLDINALGKVVKGEHGVHVVAQLSLAARIP